MDNFGSGTAVPSRGRTARSIVVGSLPDEDDPDAIDLRGYTPGPQGRSRIAEHADEEGSSSMGFGDQEKVLSGHGGIGRPVRNSPSPVGLQAVTRFVGFGVAIGVSAAIGQHENGHGGGEYAGLSLREPGGGAEGLESGGGVAPDEEMRALRKAG